MRPLLLAALILGLILTAQAATPPATSDPSYNAILDDAGRIGAIGGNLEFGCTLAQQRWKVAAAKDKAEDRVPRIVYEDDDLHCLRDGTKAYKIAVLRASQIAKTCNQVAIKKGPPFDGEMSSIKFKPLAPEYYPVQFFGTLEKIDRDEWIILSGQTYAILLVSKGSITSFSDDDIAIGRLIAGFGSAVGPASLTMSNGGELTVLEIRALCIEGQSSLSTQLSSDESEAAFGPPPPYVQPPAAEIGARLVAAQARGEADAKRMESDYQFYLWQLGVRLSLSDPSCGQHNTEYETTGTYHVEIQRSGAVAEMTLDSLQTRRVHPAKQNPGSSDLMTNAVNKLFDAATNVGKESGERQAVIDHTEAVRTWMTKKLKAAGPFSPLRADIKPDMQEIDMSHHSSVGSLELGVS